MELFNNCEQVFATAVISHLKPCCINIPLSDVEQIMNLRIRMNDLIRRDVDLPMQPRVSLPATALTLQPRTVLPGDSFTKKIQPHL